MHEAEGCVAIFEEPTFMNSVFSSIPRLQNDLKGPEFEYATLERGEKYSLKAIREM